MMNMQTINANDPEYVKSLLNARKEIGILKLVTLLPLVYSTNNNKLRDMYLKVLPVFLSYAVICNVNVEKALKIVEVIRGLRLFLSEKNLFDNWFRTLSDAIEQNKSKSNKKNFQKKNFSGSNRFVAITGTNFVDTIGYAELDFFNCFHRFLKFHKLHKYLYFFANLSYFEIIRIDETNIRKFEEKVNVFPMTTGARNAILRKLAELNTRKSRLHLLCEIKYFNYTASNFLEVIAELKGILRTPIRGNTIYKEENSLPDLIIEALSKVTSEFIRSRSLIKKEFNQIADELIAMMKRSWSCNFFTHEQKRWFNTWRKQLEEKKESYLNPHVSIVRTKSRNNEDEFENLMATIIKQVESVFIKAA